MPAAGRAREARSAGPGPLQGLADRRQQPGGEPGDELRDAGAHRVRLPGPRGGQVARRGCKTRSGRLQSIKTLGSEQNELSGQNTSNDKHNKNSKNNKWIEKIEKMKKPKKQ